MIQNPKTQPRVNRVILGTAVVERRRGDALASHMAGANRPPPEDTNVNYWTVCVAGLFAMFSPHTKVL
jgi:hypothetical protein